MEISKLTTPNEWVYFAKGNANILFKYIGTHDYLKHKLLRIRLNKTENEGYISTCQLYDFIELKCKPLFPKEILEIQLIVLTTDFLNCLDTKGHQIMIKEKYGLLLPNILDGDFTSKFLSKNCTLYTQHENNVITSIILEIKPKWLYDNLNSNYCRTCALNQFKQLERHFCPLDFLYEDTYDTVISDLFSKLPSPELDELNGTIPIQEIFKKYLSVEDNFFQRLKHFQKLYDTSLTEVRNEKDVPANLSLVMTLRDLGLFIKFEKFDDILNIRLNSSEIFRSNSDINVFEINGQKYIVYCNVVDLDLKPNIKFKHWINVDGQLQKYNTLINPDWKICANRKSI